MSEVQTEATGPQSSVVEETQQKIQQGAGQAQGAMRNALAGKIDEGSVRLGRQLREVAGAFRQAGGNMQPEGNGSAERVVTGVSERVERMGSYLEESSSDRLMHDAEHFGRRNPWLVVTGGLAVGIALSRLLKASSNSRFDQLRSQGYSSRRRESQWAQLPAPGGTYGYQSPVASSVSSEHS